MASEMEDAVVALAANLALHTTSLDALTTQATALVAAEVAKSLPQGVTAGSLPFSACNQAAADTAATPVVVYTNPGATRLFVTEARVFNVTTAEIGAGAIQGSGDVTLAQLEVGSFDGQALGGTRGVHKFNPPLIIPAGEDVEWVPFATVGDVFCGVVGYIEP